MPLPLRKRTIFFYELRLTSSTKAADIANPGNCGISKILQAFTALAAPAKLPMIVGKSASTITYLMDWRENAANGSYEILINKANAKLSDVAFRDLKTAVLRRAGKTKMEGIEHSAHIVIRPNNNDQTALILLTMGCGLGPSHIERVLRLMSRMASKDKANRRSYYFDDPSGAKAPDGSPIQYKVVYSFPVLGYMGQTLDEALRTGKFTSMELVAVEREKFDAGGNLQIAERTLKVSAAIPETVTGATVRNGLRFFQSQPDAQLYDRLRLNYKSRSGRSASTTLEINDLDAAFTRREIVELDAEVDSQQLLLDGTIIEAMRPLLNDAP